MESFSLGGAEVFVVNGDAQYSKVGWCSNQKWNTKVGEYRNSKSINEPSNSSKIQQIGMFKGCECCFDKKLDECHRETSMAGVIGPHSARSHE